MKTKIFCNNCKRKTNHEQIEQSKNEYDSDDNFIELITNTVYKCCGCQTYCIETKYTNNCYYDSNGDSIFDITYTPKRNINFIEKKNIFYITDPKVQKIYNETIDAYNNENYFLCCMGIRTCIEVILKTKDKKHEKLKTLINNATYLDSKLIDGLNSCRYLGNKVTHEMLTMDNIEIKSMLDLLEQLITQLYISENIANKVNSIATKHGMTVENK